VLQPSPVASTGRCAPDSFVHAIVQYQDVEQTEPDPTLSSSSQELFT
jgi:hypothetical protein